MNPYFYHIADFFVDDEMSIGMGFCAQLAIYT